MTNKFSAMTQFLRLAAAFGFLATGCQSAKTVKLYEGPEAPVDQLATLVAPWCISLRAVDGVPAPSTFSDELRMLLKPGPHRVEARYVVLYPTGNGNTEKIVSDYVPLTFIGKAGKTYVIGSQDPKTLEATRDYAAHVSLWIEERGTGSAKGVATGVPVPPAVTATDSKAETVSTTPTGENPEIQAQLEAIWKNASEQDRKAFLDKVQPQAR